MSLSEVIPYTPALFSGILRRGSRSWRVAVVRDEECTVVVGKSEARYHSEDLVVDGRIILTLRLLMSYIYIYIYMEHLFLMFLDHTQRRTTVGRTPLDE